MTIALGLAFAAGALAVILLPLFVPQPSGARPDHAPPLVDPAVGQAQDAEIESAVRHYRMEHPECPTCGLRPEADAAYCSSCGRMLPREAG